MTLNAQLGTLKGLNFRKQNSRLVQASRNKTYYIAAIFEKVGLIYV